MIKVLESFKNENKMINLRKQQLKNKDGKYISKWYSNFTLYSFFPPNTIL